MTYSPHMGTSTLHPSPGLCIPPCRGKVPMAVPHRRARPVLIQPPPHCPGWWLGPLGMCFPCQRQCKGWDPPFQSHQHPNQLGGCSARGCPPAQPVPGVWGRQRGWGPASAPAFKAPAGWYPQQGFQPLPCTLLPLQHPPLGAGRRMRRGALPHCKDAPGDGWRRLDPSSPPRREGQRGRVTVLGLGLGCTHCPGPYQRLSPGQPGGPARPAGWPCGWLLSHSEQTWAGRGV